MLAGTGTVLGQGVGNPVTFTPQLNINIPAGQTYGLYITSNGGTGFSYSNGTAVGNLLSQNPDLKVFEGKGGGYYAVTISTRNWNGNIYYTKAGCTSPMIPVTLTVNPTPTLTTNASTTTICSGKTVTLSAGGMNTYTWSTASTNTSIAVTPSTSSTYTLSAYSTLCNVTQTAAFNITVNQTPTVTLVAGATTICSSPGNIALSGSPSGGVYSGTSVSGNLLSIAASGTFNPVYSYTNASTGCSNSASVTVIVSNCTGFNTASATTSTINVYPNPNQGSFTIDTYNTSEKTIEIVDVTGRVVLFEKATDESIKINISDLANGLYQVRIKSENELHMIKVIKQ